MNTFIYIIGLFIGIATFLYILSLYESGMEKIKKTTPAKEKISKPLNPNTVSFKNRPATDIGTRICPLCGSSLTKYEGLYASKITNNAGAKLMIMGCKYCFKNEEDSKYTKEPISE